MADLTPDERAALIAAIDKASASDGCIVVPAAIWRAARAFENEACAKVCESWVDNTTDPFCCEPMALGIAAAIRERAKGLT